MKFKDKLKPRIKARIRKNKQVIHKNINNKKDVFATNQTKPGMIFKNSILNGGKYPPMKNVTVIALTNIIFAYSPRKNMAKLIDEYSTL